ncbi:hypothetical protein [Pseudonocardia oroxyli]|uniref:Uncharacterized protein n=1 Tax=Pseudonocardia oroxyli TaxID=366584 RepID=A0A1G7GXR3_PSEOR|nr:hypothetical protein [Pseudonocardia oroxyli]SDE92854.1 hypothetical protein SAMN05216377_102490 [Pseudonocardia oroxyli]
MPPELHVTTHLHTDGPIPGPHSLLTLTAAAHTAAGVPIGTFTVNLRELPGATLHPASLQDWRTKAEEWLSTRRASKPPALATIAFTRWVSRLPGRPVFVAEPEAYLFVYWYAQRFTDGWPFVGTLPPEAVADRSAAARSCTLPSCRAQPASAG